MINYQPYLSVTQALACHTICLMSQHAYFQRHDAHQNLHRFYQLWVTPGLFGDWSLVREWGRVGSPGTVRKIWFETESDAEKAGLSILNAKVKKGYVQFQIVPAGQ